MSPVTSGNKDYKMHRAKADELLEGLKQRVEEVNEQEGRFAYRIT